jgi:hypothetical protein
MLPELHMVELLDLGEEAPGWAWSRWVSSQAFRWMLMNGHRRVDVAATATMHALHPALDVATLHPEELSEVGTGLAAGNRLVAELALHEFGGLAEFLTAKATPTLLDRCDGVRRWGRAPMRAYLLTGTRRDRLLARDMTDGDEVELLNLGALCDRHDSDFVLGRAVPTSIRPARLFSSRPFDIDPLTARDIGRLGKADTLEWLDVLRDGVEAGRVDPYAFWDGYTPLGSDVAFEPFGSPTDEADAETRGRMKELLAAGLSPEAAEGVLVCEVGLVGVQVSGASVGHAMPHVATVLSQRAVFEAAMRHACGPGTADAWAAIADLVPEPARTRCRALSRRAREAA